MGQSILVTIVIILLFTAIIISLFTGLWFLLRGSDGRKLLGSLTIRISLTVLLMLVVVWAWFSGLTSQQVPWLG
ncbi:hypothetical protein CI610_01451 [invertebrate metagenome]|uniref:Twin transmembrane helix small protein n=1 Tax=invertebrate metagenome TaxID=1711999 RepID=A0A2H9T8L4_9ZZZZ